MKESSKYVPWNVIFQAGKKNYTGGCKSLKPIQIIRKIQSIFKSRKIDIKKYPLVVYRDYIHEIYMNSISNKKDISIVKKKSTEDYYKMNGFVLYKIKKSQK